MTKQIAYLQDSTDRTCATDTVAYQCSRACETTLDGQMSAVEWVSKKLLGPCKNYNFRFTKKHAAMRTAIGAPKSGRLKDFVTINYNLRLSCHNRTSFHRPDNLHLY